MCRIKENCRLIGDLDGKKNTESRLNSASDLDTELVLGGEQVQL